MNAQTLLALFLAEARERSLWTWGSDDADDLTAMQLLRAASGHTRAQVVSLAAEALAVPAEGASRYDSAWSPALGFLITALLPQTSGWDATRLTELASSMSRWPAWDWMDIPPYDVVLDRIATELEGEAAPSDMARMLRDLRVRLAVEGSWDDAQRLRFARLDAILSGGVLPGAFDPSDAWAEAANTWISTRGSSAIKAWEGVVQHAATGVRGAPSASWRRQARQHLAELGALELSEGLAALFPHVPVGLTRAQAEHRQTLSVRYQVQDAEGVPIGLADTNRMRVRGLCWTAGLVEGDAPQFVAQRIVAALRGLASAGYARIPGVGAGDLLLANAAVRGLASLPLAQGRPALSELLAEVELARARRWIERALAGMEGGPGSS